MANYPNIIHFSDFTAVLLNIWKILFNKVVTNTVYIQVLRYINFWINLKFYP